MKHLIYISHDNLINIIFILHVRKMNIRGLSKVEDIGVGIFGIMLHTL